MELKCRVCSTKSSLSIMLYVCILVIAIRSTLGLDGLIHREAVFRVRHCGSHSYIVSPEIAILYCMDESGKECGGFGLDNPQVGTAQYISSNAPEYTCLALNVLYGPADWTIYEKVKRF